MVIIPIISDIDIFKARRAGKELAKDIGFLQNGCSMIEIVVSELASNILRYAGRGTISVKAVDNGIEIVSKDEGPGIENVEEILKGANNKKSLKGLGIGLAGVKRMMDELEICSGQGKGNTIIAKKWINGARGIAGMKQDNNVRLCGLMKYGIVSIPAYGAESNGDAYVIRESCDKNILMAVIDGLGHGKDACAASSEAANYIFDNHMRGLPSIMEGCHHALLRTRGAAIGIVRINLEAGKIAFAGVGNVSVRIRGNTVLRPVSSAGIVGYNFKRAMEDEYPYQKGDVIVMYSDGISGRFDTSGMAAGADELQMSAEDAVREFGNDNDDNTIIAGKEAQ